MTLEVPPVTITLPSNLYKDAVESFEKNGLELDQAINTAPRIAYATFGICLRDVLLDSRTGIVDEKRGIVVDKKLDGSQVFNAIGNISLDVLPQLGNENQQVIVRTVKDPSFLEWLFRKKIDQEPRVALQFEVPAI